MAKKAKVPFEDWKAPWAEGEFDADKAARLIYGLQNDKIDLQDRVDTVGAEIVDLKEKLAASGGDADKLASMQTKLDEMVEKQADTDLENLRLTVAAEKKLTPSQAGRLRGKTRDELLTDADVLLADFAPKKDPEEEELPPPTKSPATTRRRNPGASSDDQGGERSVEQVLAHVPRRNALGL